MGNKQNKSNAPAGENSEIIDRNPLNQTEAKVDSGISSRYKSKRKGKSCFGARKDTNIDNLEASKLNSTNKKSYYSHETRKSTIKVNNMPNSKVDDRLFADR
jgi:hypothetical protein